MGLGKDTLSISGTALLEKKWEALNIQSGFVGFTEDIHFKEFPLKKEQEV